MKLLEKMLDKLTSAYNAKPYSFIGKLFSIFAGMLEQLLVTLDVIELWKDIDQASGSTLDRLGANFGVKRQGMNDVFFRIVIQTKVTALLSSGDINTIIEAVATLFGIDPSRVELKEVYPAKVEIGVHEVDLTDEKITAAPLIMQMAKRVLAAGVGLRIIKRAYFDTQTSVQVAVAVTQCTRISITAEFPRRRAEREALVYVAAMPTLLSHIRIDME